MKFEYSDKYLTPLVTLEGKVRSSCKDIRKRKMQAFNIKYKGLSLKEIKKSKTGEEDHFEINRSNIEIISLVKSRIELEFSLRLIHGVEIKNCHYSNNGQNDIFKNRVSYGSANTLSRAGFEIFVLYFYITQNKENFRNYFLCAFKRLQKIWNESKRSSKQEYLLQEMLKMLNEHDISDKEIEASYGKHQSKKDKKAGLSHINYLPLTSSMGKELSLSSTDRDFINYINNEIYSYLSDYAHSSYLAMGVKLADFHDLVQEAINVKATLEEKEGFYHKSMVYIIYPLLMMISEIFKKNQKEKEMYELKNEIHNLWAKYIAMGIDNVEEIYKMRYENLFK